ncbi:hypothetical protein [uncultured Paraglaciecola sp.]|uniref:hypothetical protein n=1 Tax=uncultured Paraglaciecola sp. TaxID=1765024 RepID=UPI0030D8BE50|tara:strand:- start:50486 stop:50839 length:354 start_codon:yes stop_codon:yes gene_type:complete
MSRLLEGFDERQIILGTIVFYIVALAFNLGTLHMYNFNFFSQSVYSQKINFNITDTDTLQSIAAKVETLNNNKAYDSVDILLSCSKTLCTVTASSKYNIVQTLKAKHFLQGYPVLEE